MERSGEGLTTGRIQQRCWFIILHLEPLVLDSERVVEIEAGEDGLRERAA